MLRVIMDISAYEPGVDGPFGSAVLAGSGETDPPSLLILSRTSAGNGTRLCHAVPRSRIRGLGSNNNR
jgi:hypothetical protein